VLIKPLLQDSIKEHLFNNRVPNPINVTFTEKQMVGVTLINEHLSDTNFRHFKNMLNTKVFGNSFKRFGKQLKMIVVREGGKGLRYHLHTIIEQPERYTLTNFEILIRDCWKRTDFGHNQVHIEKPITQEREDGWLYYILKERSKLDFSNSIVWEHTYI
jgi:hypothetical protein